MPPPQEVVVFDRIVAILVEGRRARWFQRPLRGLVLLSPVSLSFFFVLLLTVVAASAREAEGDTSAGDGHPRVAPLHFLSADADFGGERVFELGPVREGYATLWWSPSPTAAAYQLTNRSGETVYMGHLPHAFVSGLGDGRHHFKVIGIGPSGNIVAAGAAPITVEVRHWSGWLAWTLFAIGAVTVSMLVIVLLIGSSTTRGETTSGGGGYEGAARHRPQSEAASDGGTIAAEAGEA